MKVIVPTYTRVGSTMICEAISSLTGYSWKSLEINRLRNNLAEIEDFNRIESLSNGVYKTHSYTPLSLIGGRFKIVTIVRNKMDMLISLLMYKRHHQPSIGAKVEDWFSSFSDQNQGLSDADFINAVIANRADEIKQKLEEAACFSVPVFASNILTINYEDFIEDQTQGIVILANFLGISISEDQTQKILIDISKKNLSTKYNKDQVGNARFIREARG